MFTRTSGSRDGRQWADGVWRPPAVPTGSAGGAALRAFPGWFVSTPDAELAGWLVSHGAREVRHAHVMSHDLAARVDVVPVHGLQVEPLTPSQLTRHARRLAQVGVAAYPAGHPDHSHPDAAAAEGELLAIARGELLGPMLPESRVALHGRRIVGTCLVVDREGEPPDGGPWVVDIFRDPAVGVPGIGRAMLAAALAAARAAHRPGLSLAVTHANEPARRVYRALGFVETSQSWTLLLPGHAPS